MMGIIKDAYTRAVLKPLADFLIERNLQKQDIEKGQQVGPVLRDRLYWANAYAQYGSNKSKPGSAIDWKVLRQFSKQYDVARAAINRRKRQLNMLEWKIVPKDPEATENTALSKKVTQEFTNLAGYKIRFREFMDMMVEDLLVLDAVSIYKRPNRGGGLYQLQPLDATTIKLRVDEAGGTPEPPDIAYLQYIRGEKVAEFTADEMYYEMMNARTESPYGLSPLESMIVSVSTALKSQLANMHMLTEGNIPEGYFGVPDTWSPDKIREFQEIWDAAMAGDTKATSRIKFGPQGSYDRFIKPEDMRFKELQEWLMKTTCMMFEIPPQELGFTETVNRSTGEVQHDIAVDSGLRPLARFFEEIFTDVLNLDMGYEDLKFSFVGLEETNEREIAEIAEIRIRSGQTTVDEVRNEQGLTPLGVDQPFVLGSPTFIDKETQDKKAQAEADAKAAAAQAPVTGDEANATEEEKTPQGTTTAKKNYSEDAHIQLVTELRTFRKYALNRISKGKSLRPFNSKVLPADVVTEMNNRLTKAADITEAKAIFTEYMQDYQVKFLSDVQQVRGELREIL